MKQNIAFKNEIYYYSKDLSYGERFVNNTPCTKMYELKVLKDASYKPMLQLQLESDIAIPEIIFIEGYESISEIVYDSGDCDYLNIYFKDGYDPKQLIVFKLIY